MSGPVLAAIARAAAEATGAGAGWILSVRGDRLEVSAVAGVAPVTLLGSRVAAGSGAAGYVIESGQPLAITPRGDDPRSAEGVAAALGRRPSSLVCVPCESKNGISGALELIDKKGGGSFSFDDVELATLLAGIAGVAIDDGFSAAAGEQPSPATFAESLTALAADDPPSYAALVTILQAMTERA
jgi:GAF domain-containing protein